MPYTPPMNLGPRKQKKCSRDRNMSQGEPYQTSLLSLVCHREGSIFGDWGRFWYSFATLRGHRGALTGRDVFCQGKDGVHQVLGYIGKLYGRACADLRAGSLYHPAASATCPLQACITFLGVHHLNDIVFNYLPDEVPSLVREGENILWPVYKNPCGDGPETPVLGEMVEELNGSRQVVGSNLAWNRQGSLSKPYFLFWGKLPAGTRAGAFMAKVRRNTAQGEVWQVWCMPVSLCDWHSEVESCLTRLRQRRVKRDEYI
ncbi:hypothetical protein R1sor_005956 [Riccia sorocarpa]|uniref:LAGLIDADG homing endonuclease n=1 Tax=Riccia sorocarpa TaxID=122646 RepID=A0ABD3HPU9_9MARC